MKRELIELVRDRANRKCEYCHFPSDVAWLPFQIDHIIAEKHHGRSVSENLAFSCYYCNSFKGPNIAGIDADGEPDAAIQLFHPRKDRWSGHFEWNGPVLAGKTAVGRATISVLKINILESIELRQTLLESGFSI